MQEKNECRTALLAKSVGRRWPLQILFEFLAYACSCANDGRLFQAQKFAPKLNCFDVFPADRGDGPGQVKTAACRRPKADLLADFSATWERLGTLDLLRDSLAPPGQIPREQACSASGAAMR